MTHLLQLSLSHTTLGAHASFVDEHKPTLFERVESIAWGSYDNFIHTHNAAVRFVASLPRFVIVLVAVVLVARVIAEATRPTTRHPLDPKPKAA